MLTDGIFTSIRQIVEARNILGHLLFFFSISVFPMESKQLSRLFCIAHDSALFLTIRNGSVNEIINKVKILFLPERNQGTWTPSTRVGSTSVGFNWLNNWLTKPVFEINCKRKWDLEMDLPLALKVLIISLEILFVSRLLGKTGVQLLQVFAPSMDGSFALQLGLFQSGYLVQQSLLLFFPNADLCD